MTPVRLKVAVAVLLVLVVGTACVGYLLVTTARRAADTLANVHLPKEQAVREVEVSVWETANAIFYYVTDPSATSLAEYHKQLKDVKEYMDRYKALSASDAEQQMAAEFDKLWADVVSTSAEIIVLRDQLTDRQEQAWNSVHIADDIIDYKIQAALVKDLPDLLAKEKAVREVEVSIWEALNAANFYIFRQWPTPAQEIAKQLEEVERFWAQYKGLTITSSEEPYLKEFEDAWATATERIKECLALADTLRAKYLALWEAVHEADDVIDFRIQEHLQKQLREGR